MKITELLLAELDRRAVSIRSMLERVPEGTNDWKPHENSMRLGYLARIVATILPWLDMREHGRTRHQPARRAEV